ncbi:MAG: DNA polymerase III subunit beta [Pseudomonadales bacterium]
MKIKIATKALLSIMNCVIGTVENNSITPILQNVLFTVDKNLLTITSSNLEVEMSTETQLDKCTESFSSTLPARKLHDIVKALPDSSVLTLTFDKKKEKATLTCGRSRFTLTTLSANDFPTIEVNNKQSNTLTIDASILNQLIANTQFAMAHRDVRYYLNGMFFRVDNKELSVVATDGHRLSTNTIDITSTINPCRELIVPRKGIAEMLKALKWVSGDVTLTFSANHICLKGDCFNLISKLVDGKYPDFESVIPKSNDKRLVADLGHLQSSLKRASILTHDKTNGVKLSLTNNQLQVNTNSLDVGGSEDFVDIEYSDANLVICFNVAYLLDALNVINGSKAVIDFGSSNNSIIIHGKQATGSRNIVMPIRM